MKLRAKTLARLAFWITFLVAAGVAARVLWVKADPLRNHPLIAKWWLEYNHARLASRDPAAAARAYLELERCYLSKWAAYDWVVWRVKEDIWRKDDPPIHFHLERSGYRYYARPMPNRSECRTVNEALMAMLHQDSLWRTAYSGDWRKWWDDNWTRYPNRHLLGKPSGPEDPRGRRR